MVNLFGTMVGFLGFFQSRDQGLVNIDNPPFRLHYDFTTGFFFLSTALLSLNDMFGKNIQCMGYKNGKVQEADSAVTQYCWVTGTYTVPGVDTMDQDKLANIGHAGRDHKDDICKTPPNNGKQEMFKYNKITGDISPMNKTETDRYKDDDEVPLCKKTHSYYQWVPFLFVFQGLLFMIPHKIWKSLEEGKMSSISAGVTLANKQKEEDRLNMVKNIARFVEKDNRTYGHKKYAYGFLFCQFLNLLNVIFNIWLLDAFIEGHFLDLGFKWINASGDGDDRLLKGIFPRMTLCEWKTLGTSGYDQFRSFICLLATNIITEKVFVFLWFWLFFLLIVSTCVIVYFCLMLFSKSEHIRNYFLAFAIRMRVSKLRQTDINEKDDKKKVINYLGKLPSTNFFFLYLLASNVDTRCLQDLLREIADRKLDVLRIKKTPREF